MLLNWWKCGVFPRFTGVSSHASLKVFLWPLSSVPRTGNLAGIYWRWSPIHLLRDVSGEFKTPLVTKRGGGDWFRYDHLLFQLVGCFLRVYIIFFLMSLALNPHYLKLQRFLRRPGCEEVSKTPLFSKLHPLLKLCHWRNCINKWKSPEEERL